MENTINFEPAAEYVCLEHPEELKKIVNGTIFQNMTEKQQFSYMTDYINKNGSIYYEIITIRKDSSEYKIGDKVLIDGNMENKAIKKPKESWKNPEVPEFDTFILVSIGQIQGKLIY